MTRPADVADIDALMAEARAARERAYAPYSHFLVGAAVATDAGVFGGANVENASYGLSICAERVALFTAIAAGARRVTRLAVSCARPGPTDPPASRMPCGACRQVMAELMAGESKVVVDGVGVLSVDDLLPQAFQLAARPFLDARSAQETESETR